MPQRKSSQGNKRKAIDSAAAPKRRAIARGADETGSPSVVPAVEGRTERVDDDCGTSEPKEAAPDNFPAREDDDEEAWLDALEKGNLDDYGGLKKEKDPSLLTARQKAIKERGGTSAKLETCNTTKVELMSEEAQKKKAEKNKRRKLQAVRKAEESQKQTIERLVKQQGFRASKDRQRKTGGTSEHGNASQPAETKSTPMIKYESKGHFLFLSFPAGCDCPIQCSTQPVAKPRPPCIVCGKPKRYNCSITNKPVCSMECYKVNLRTQLLREPPKDTKDAAISVALS